MEPPGELDRRQLLHGASRLLVGAAGGALLGGGTADAVQRVSDRGDAQSRGAAKIPGQAGPPAQLRVLWGARTTEPMLALTFDDGPFARFTAPLLEVLARHRVAATFCVVGRQVEAQRALVRRELSGRHELVNHSWSHADLSLLDRSAVRAELSRTDQLLHDVTGRAPALVRPPYGHVSGLVLEGAASAGQDVLLWDAQVRDRGWTSAQNARFVLDHLRPGMVLLAHDAGAAYRHVGMAAIEPIIRGARARGFRFVTASELFAEDGQRSQASTTSRL